MRRVLYCHLPSPFSVKIDEHGQDEDDPLDHSLRVGRDLQKVLAVGQHPHDEGPHRCPARSLNSRKPLPW